MSNWNGTFLQILARLEYDFKLERVCDGRRIIEHIHVNHVYPGESVVSL